MIARIVQWWRRRRHQRATSTSARVRDCFKQISYERRMQIGDVQSSYRITKELRDELDAKIGRAIPEPRIDLEIQHRVARSL